MAKTGAKSASDAIAQEMAKLQGTWKPITGEKGGLKESLDEFGDLQARPWDSTSPTTATAPTVSPCAVWPPR